MTSLMKYKNYRDRNEGQLIHQSVLNEATWLKAELMGIIGQNDSPAQLGLPITQAEDSDKQVGYIVAQAQNHGVFESNHTSP
jgi:hypothetical protein